MIQWAGTPPPLQNPVSKSGKPREEKRSMIQWVGGKVSPGVISPMNPGPYRPVMRGGVARRGGSTNRPSPGGSSSRPATRWSPAPLPVGTVR